MVKALKSPKITLLGAGPGDPDLITRKGWKALQSADVVLYDALIHPDLLAEIPSGVPCFYVGKRCSQHSFSQAEINRQLVDCARFYGHAVRLKGGDPYVFGRGMEEVQYAKSQGIEQIEVIPGISSAIAGPAAAGIPVTSRGHSNSFWVLSASTKTGELNKDLEMAAQSSATVVILMGIQKLDAILELFQQHRKTDTPVAIIQNATMPDQKTIIGKIGTLLYGAKKTDSKAPGLVVIGEVVDLAQLTLQQVQAGNPISHAGLR
jgi:uroporphyrin-III C-methyltransferase